MRSNRLLLGSIARAIQPMLGDVVFVGGATTELFLTHPAATRVRLTRDADVICQISGRPAYYRLGEQLRALGFAEDTSLGAPLCRWHSEAGILDVMPIDEEILGFTNPWYRYGIQTAITIELEAELRIQILRAPVFIATKLAAYANRGDGDLLGSHDLEDIVTVVAFRPAIVDELEAETEELRSWVADRIREYFIDDPDAEDVVAGSLPDSRNIPSLVRETRERLRAITLARDR